MNISEIKDLLAQFDASTLREFSYKNNGEELNLSKNQTSSVTAAPVAPTVEVVAPAPQAPVAPVAAPAAVETPATPVEEASAPAQAAEGEVHLSVWLTCLHHLKNQPLFLLATLLRKVKLFLSLKR